MLINFTKKELAIITMLLDYAKGNLSLVNEPSYEFDSILNKIYEDQERRRRRKARRTKLSKIRLC
jgi:hypothetical protein